MCNLDERQNERDEEESWDAATRPQGRLNMRMKITAHHMSDAWMIDLNKFEVNR